MNSKKAWSFLLLIAMSFSLLHDYAFVLFEDDHCSMKEYVSELTVPNANADCEFCNTHFEYHTAYILPSNSLKLSTVHRYQTIFTGNTLFTSWNYSNFFKPPIS